MVLSTLFVSSLYCVCPQMLLKLLALTMMKDPKKKIHGGGWWGCPDINNNMKKEKENCYFLLTNLKQGLNSKIERHSSIIISTLD